MSISLRMEDSVVINHVMSNDVQSGIFFDILRYFERYRPNDSHIVVSKGPVDGADIYHYHRPHLEKELKGNSVCTVHHDLSDTDNWLAYENFDPLYRQASKIICLNSNQRKFLNKRGIKKTELIPHGYNSEIFSLLDNVSIEKEKITLGLVSKRYGRKVKGEEHLYEIVKRLDPTKFSFLLVGEGRSKDASYIKDLGFEVRVYEYLPYKLFGSLYEEINALLMLSLYEGGPANIPEAIVSGTPIIGMNVGMVSDYVKDRENGVLLTGDADVDALKIDNFWSDYTNIKNRALDVKNKAISWERNIEMHFTVYGDIFSAGDK